MCKGPGETDWVFWGKVARWQGAGRSGVKDVGRDPAGLGREFGIQS